MGSSYDHSRQLSMVGVEIKSEPRLMGYYKPSRKPPFLKILLCCLGRYLNEGFDKGTNGKPREKERCICQHTNIPRGIDGTWGRALRASPLGYFYVMYSSYTFEEFCSILSAQLMGISVASITSSVYSATRNMLAGSNVDI